MIRTAILGYPRIGKRRELKWALEKYWSGQIGQDDLLKIAYKIRIEQWKHQQQLGLDIIPSNDFSLYDHVLDTIAMLGAVPERFNWSGETVDLDTYFEMARGIKHGHSAQAMEMSKWFNTNYHFIVPEFHPNQTFKLSSTKAIDEFIEAQQVGIHTRPVVLGPVSFLHLGKAVTDDFEPLELLDQILEVYLTLLTKLASVGADWIQIDEPCLVLDLDNNYIEAYKFSYQRLSNAPVKLMLTPYFGGLRDNLLWVMSLPVAGLHLDLVSEHNQLYRALELVPDGKVLSLGMVDGRNIWRTDLDKALKNIKQAVNTLGEDRIIISSSCSLMFVPYDLNLESKLDNELRSWLAFADQKIAELTLLKKALQNEEDAEVAQQLEAQRHALQSRLKSSRVYAPHIRERLANLSPAMLDRKSNHDARKAIQTESLKLPLLPTTTIGSFPQTNEIRAKRLAFYKGIIGEDEYEEFIRRTIEQTIRFQEEIGLDVLVHGEFERTDMVEYFAEQLSGFAVTQNGWVQSYGSRCVRPPIIYGDIERLRPMTVKWTKFAQSLTNKPVKGILTGPVTILKWSFARDDQHLAITCRQIALALRDEVLDLESAGIKIIQIDEPAFREALPLRRSDWNEFLKWAVECFRLVTSGVKDETQIHTHMCYSEFNDIIDAIEQLDADVISIETSRSKMDLLTVFVNHKYPNDIGPGIYDVHSPRIPSKDEIEQLLAKALGVLSAKQLWVNPDCGLKTRNWEEIKPSLQNMVAAAEALREKVNP